MKTIIVTLLTLFTAVISAFAQDFQGMAVYESKTSTADFKSNFAGNRDITPEMQKTIEERMKQMFEKFGNYTNLRVYGVHDKGDTEFDKNHISLGLDVLIGTPNRLSDLFSTAGFHVNQLKLFSKNQAIRLSQKMMLLLLPLLPLRLHLKTNLVFKMQKPSVITGFLFNTGFIFHQSEP